MHIKKKKIAIITWCTYTNFGTYLQAYALQSYLSGLGYDAYLLDDSKFITCCQKLYFRRFLGRLKYKLKKIIRPSYKKNLSLDRTSTKLFNDFRNRYLVLDKNVSPLHKLNDKYDMFICGSDQIWNPKGFDISNNNDFFFANFTHNKKISYASSIGIMSIPQKYKKHFANLISDFSYLSVRENAAIASLKELTNKEIAIVVDPTFLLSFKKWNQLIDGRHVQIKDNYVLLYMLSYNDNYIKYAFSFASKHHLNIKIIQTIGVDFKGLQTEVAGPLEFLYLIRKANYIFTDSFHGTIFSIIFERQFVVFKRFNDLDKCSQNIRISNLLEMCKLENRFIDQDGLCNIDKLDNVNFEIVKEFLNAMISTSKDYLNNAVN